MPSARTSLYQGMKDGLPIALGYLSVSFAFGMLSVKNGPVSYTHLRAHET